MILGEQPKFTILGETPIDPAILTPKPPVLFGDLSDLVKSEHQRATLDTAIDVPYHIVVQAMVDNLGLDKIGKEPRVIRADRTKHITSDWNQKPATLYGIGGGEIAVIDGVAKEMREAGSAARLLQLHSTISIIPEGRIPLEYVGELANWIIEGNIGAICAPAYERRVIGYNQRILESFEQILRRGYVAFSISGVDFSIGITKEEAENIPKSMGWDLKKRGQHLVVLEWFQGRQLTEPQPSATYTKDGADIVVIAGVDYGKLEQGTKLGINNLKTLILLQPNKLAGEDTSIFTNIALEIMRWLVDKKVDSLYSCVWDGVVVGYNSNNPINPVVPYRC